VKIAEIFASKVTRDIPPVIYFHEQDPARVKDEVSEYIVTGGYPKGHVLHLRHSDGIHEQYVRLLGRIAAELDRKGGPELPACWISGFFGSGKSSFAKLLGLALDGMVLPDGRPLFEALLARDQSPLAPEFRQAWEALAARVKPLAVVFDVGAVARDDEQVHTAVKRMVQERLGYCKVSRYVADTELDLELDGHWERFLEVARQTLGKPWEEARQEQLAEDAFSEVMSALFPTRFPDPFTWLDVKSGAEDGARTGAAETVKALGAMLDRRAPGRTLFLVVDEVSQYVHDDDHRMLKLQSFVEALGQRLRGRVWLLATGQQKLEEDLEGSNLTKLKDRFPKELRVHLSSTNIRDVVHKRLLHKNEAGEEAVRQLFRSHRSHLANYGFECDGISEVDFVHVYPMLPGHVDLLMEIASQLRRRSSRVKGDDHAIRGLLQLLGEIFRQQRFHEEELGALLTLDRIYDVQSTALEADVQNTMARLLAHADVQDDLLARRAAKAVALLEQVQETMPTTARLVAKCLYDRMGLGNREPEVARALERLRELGFLTLSEKQGYRIQSSAGQEWARDRDSYQVTGTEVSKTVRERLRLIVGEAAANRPKLRGRGFPVAALFSDGRDYTEDRVVSPADAAVVTFDLQFRKRQEEVARERWLPRSSEETARNRILWVSGAARRLEERVRELVKSRHAVDRFGQLLSTLPEGRRRAFFDEQTRLEGLEKEVNDLICEVFLEGQLYFRSREISPLDYGGGFAGALVAVAEEVLPSLYEHFVDLAITDGELRQLLQDDLLAPSPKFMPGGLGILELDSGKYVPTCKGEVPARILEFLKAEKGASGSTLLAAFGGPPYGYPGDVIRACVLGLLRAHRITVRSEANQKITSYRDVGVQDLFTKDRDFKKADFLLKEDETITGRDRVAMRKLFCDSLGKEVGADEEHLADAVFEHFPAQAERLREVYARLARLPEKPPLPKPLADLDRTLERCMGSRYIEQTLLALRKHLPALRDGFAELSIYHADLTSEALDRVREAGDVLTVQGLQLEALGVDGEVTEARQALDRHLRGARPWRDSASLRPPVEMLRERYIQERRSLLAGNAAQAEEVRTRVKIRADFRDLDPSEQAHVLAPINSALCDTTAEAVAPELSFLRDSVPARLREAEGQAQQRLDDLIARKKDQHVVAFPLAVHGRELATEADVEALLDELRERLVQQLKANTRIRIV